MSRRMGQPLLGVLLVAFAASAQAADASAGKALTEAKCAECHEPADWQGESADSIQAMIKDVVGGKTKHKVTLKLSEAEIADIAAFWSGGAAPK
jgi:mono/diheme cytochrome c family protein